MKLNASVTTTSVTQAANDVLGKEEQKLYYLVIKNEKEDTLVINVGKKTHDRVQELTKTLIPNEKIKGGK